MLISHCQNLKCVKDSDVFFVLHSLQIITNEHFLFSIYGIQSAENSV